MIFLPFKDSSKLQMMPNCPITPRPHASFVRGLGLPSTLNPSRQRSFRQRSLNGGNWKWRLFPFVWTDAILKTELFQNDDKKTITWFPSPNFLQTQIQNYRWLLSFKIKPQNELPGTPSHSIWGWCFLKDIQCVTGKTALHTPYTWK